ncbi:cytosolic phospholipase A2 delta-like isoform X2 [Hyperolius riggenbachi]|uniref:cytosolic phospholipase A2 delta-like isoform X2 n=1 Tax=Hyperolius riggenbachi TaxID=752182 RepID=UPI0035A32600
MPRRHSAVPYKEQSIIRLLTVKVIRALNIPWADWMSNADCYVCLWLPTASNKMVKTKTVSNSSCPVWNETFLFTICSNVKNVIHLTLHDEDVISRNDLLFTVAFDVGSIAAGESTLRSFCLSTDGQQILEMEFTVQAIQDGFETIVTNGVVVSREMTGVEVCVDKMRIPERLFGCHLDLTVEDSCEKIRKIELIRPVLCGDYTYSCRFHCMKRWNPELAVELKGTAGQCRCVIPVNSISAGNEAKINLCATQMNLEVTVKAQECSEKLDTRLGFDICEEEKIFLSKRKQRVAQTLKRVLKLDRDLEEHEVPVIAVAATGGGVRAMTGFFGTLAGLKKLNLLDCVTYVTGTSGSTWTMSKLYDDANWSSKDLCEPIEEACRNVIKSKKPCFSFEKMAHYKEEMNKRAQMGYRNSSTDLWGLLIESMFYDQVYETTLSDQRKALCDGQNPLPMYVSLSVKSNTTSTMDYKEWCEFSPYEVGILKYGAYIKSEDFGSKFCMGRKTCALPESRICFLQGLWSNIFSINLMDAWFSAVSSEHFWYRFTRDNVLDLDTEEAMKRRNASAALDTRLLQPSGDFNRLIRGILTDRFLDGEHHNFLRGLQMHCDYNSGANFGPCDGILNHSPNDLTPSSEYLCMVDSAYYINASFPPLLREERKVDLILAFDYGLEDKFKTLVGTQSYCTDHNLAFPKIEVSEEDRSNPKECYAFSGDESTKCPVILHFPLVNCTFKKYKEPGVPRQTVSEMEDGILQMESFFSPYQVFRLTYSKPDFDKLVKLTQYNVENNEEMILQALRNAIACRQQCRAK